jgi:hypothetical protein
MRDAYGLRCAVRPVLVPLPPEEPGRDATRSADGEPEERAPLGPDPPRAPK